MLKSISAIPNQKTLDDSSLLAIARVEACASEHFKFGLSDCFLGVFLCIKHWALSVLVAVILVSIMNGGFL
jgi:hypothetical protein